MELIYISGTVILGLVLAYGMYRYYSRNKSNDKITQEAVRQMRDDPEAYEHGGRDELQKKIKP